MQARTELGTEPLVGYRQANDLDRGFIVGSYVQHSMHHTRDGASMRPSLFKRLQRSNMDSLLKRDDTVALVACDPDDANRLFGCLVFSFAALSEGLAAVHHAYMKPYYRRMGMMRQLAGKAGLDSDVRVLYTLKTKTAYKLGKRFADAEYMPIEQFLEEG